LLEAELAHAAQVDEVDDALAEQAAQDVETLLADADDLDVLALSDEAVRVIAGKARDRGVEGAAQAPLRRADDEKVPAVLARAGEEARRFRPRRDAAGEIAEHLGHALRIGPRRLGRALGPAQLRRRDHLHGLGDLLRRLHRGDAVAQVLEARHPWFSTASSPGLSRPSMSSAPQRRGCPAPRPGMTAGHAKDLAKASTAPLSLPVVSSERSREVRIASRMSACFERIVPRSPSSKARTRLTGSGSR